MTLFPWQQDSWQRWQQQTERLAQGYLLIGQAGSGVLEFAQMMAQGLLCSQSDSHQACGQCAQCHQFKQHTHPDFFLVARLEDKKEISIEQIRQLTEKVYTTSHQGGFKVALIDQVERLSISAFNALLKTLEEPPEKTVLILTTHQLSRLPATIISRCRKINLAFPSVVQSSDWLAQQLPSDEALIESALNANWGAPLAAKEWIVAKRFEQEADWQHDMKQLQQGQLAVSQAVVKWLKWPEPEVALDYFYLRSVAAIRAALYEQKLPLNPNWFVFQKAALLARDYWQQNSNKELLLESLCLEWLACRHTPFPLYQVSDAFQDRLVRGAQL